MTCECYQLNLLYQQYITESSSASAELYIKHPMTCQFCLYCGFRTDWSVWCALITGSQPVTGLVVKYISHLTFSLEKKISKQNNQTRHSLMVSLQLQYIHVKGRCSPGCPQGASSKGKICQRLRVTLSLQLTDSLSNLKSVVTFLHSWPVFCGFI